MDVRSVNEALLRGDVDSPGVLPHRERLRREPFTFRFEFGLDELPEEPGVILVRGARQFGKSTWLEGCVHSTVRTHGPGSAVYLNGDELADYAALIEAIRSLVPLFARQARIRRLFIDEITAVKGWERALKRLLDTGELRGTLVVTTGSRAADLRHGSERLPGRKGRLARTAYLFAPVSYSEFRRQCGALLGQDTALAYLLSGGSPIALSELATRGELPDYAVETVRDWVLGEFASAGRQRGSLLAVIQSVLRYGGTPVGQAKLAREAGLANNTVAAGYVDLLADLLCIASAFPWDTSRHAGLRRRPCKYHLINLLAGVAWHPSRLRTVADFRALPAHEQGRWMEWLVAQELWRRAAIRGDEEPDVMAFLQTRDHELDFVLSPDTFIEVKRGPASPLEFAWFVRSFPRANLTVVSASRFETDRIRAITLEDFLLGSGQP